MANFIFKKRREDRDLRVSRNVERQERTWSYGGKNGGIVGKVERRRMRRKQKGRVKEPRKTRQRTEKRRQGATEEKTTFL